MKPGAAVHLSAIVILLVFSVGFLQSNSEAVQQADREDGTSGPPPPTIEQLRQQVSAVPSDVDAIVDVQYANGGEVPLFLDLYLPKSRDDAVPLLVWIHGGGWSKGTKHWCPLTWMSGEDYAVASIQYRLSGQAPFPAQIHDCKGAIRWLRAHAEEYGIDPRRIGVAGISSGGHLAVLIGTSGDVNELEGNVGGNLDQTSRVQAVFDMCGLADFVLMIEDYPEYSMQSDTNAARLFGGPPVDRRELAELASPTSYISEDDPPLSILHGEADVLVPLKQSRLLRDHYRQANLSVSLEVIPGGEHVPREFWDSEHQRSALTFFDTHLKAAN